MTEHKRYRDKPPDEVAIRPKWAPKPVNFGHKVKTAITTPKVLETMSDKDKLALDARDKLLKNIEAMELTISKTKSKKLLAAKMKKLDELKKSVSIPLYTKQESAPLEVKEVQPITVEIVKIVNTPDVPLSAVVPQTSERKKQVPKVAVPERHKVEECRSPIVKAANPKYVPPTPHSLIDNRTKSQKRRAKALIRKKKRRIVDQEIELVKLPEAITTRPIYKRPKNVTVDEAVGGWNLLVDYTLECPPLTPTFLGELIRVNNSDFHRSFRKYLEDYPTYVHDSCFFNRQFEYEPQPKEQFSALETLVTTDYPKPYTHLWNRRLVGSETGYHAFGTLNEKPGKIRITGKARFLGRMTRGLVKRDWCNILIACPKCQTGHCRVREHEFRVEDWDDATYRCTPIWCDLQGRAGKRLMLEATDYEKFTLRYISPSGGAKPKNIKNNNNNNNTQNKKKSGDLKWTTDYGFMMLRDNGADNNDCGLRAIAALDKDSTKTLDVLKKLFNALWDKPTYLTEGKQLALLQTLAFGKVRYPILELHKEDIGLVATAADREWGAHTRCLYLHNGHWWTTTLAHIDWNFVVIDTYLSPRFSKVPEQMMEAPSVWVGILKKFFNRKPHSMIHAEFVEGLLDGPSPLKTVPRVDWFRWTNDQVIDCATAEATSDPWMKVKRMPAQVVRARELTPPGTWQIRQPNKDENPPSAPEKTAEIPVKVPIHVTKPLPTPPTGGANNTPGSQSQTPPTKPTRPPPRPPTVASKLSPPIPGTQPPKLPPKPIKPPPIPPKPCKVPPDLYWLHYDTEADYERHYGHVLDEIEHLDYLWDCFDRVTLDDLEFDIEPAKVEEEDVPIEEIGDLPNPPQSYDIELPLTQDFYCGEITAHTPFNPCIKMIPRVNDVQTTIPFKIYKWLKYGKFKIFDRTTGEDFFVCNAPLMDAMFTPRISADLQSLSRSEKQGLSDVNMSIFVNLVKHQSLDRKVSPKYKYICPPEELTQHRFALETYMRAKGWTWNRTNGPVITRTQSSWHRRIYERTQILGDEVYQCVNRNFEVIEKYCGDKCCVATDEVALYHEHTVDTYLGMLADIWRRIIKIMPITSVPENQRTKKWRKEQQAAMTIRSSLFEQSLIACRRDHYYEFRTYNYIKEIVDMELATIANYSTMEPDVFSARINTKFFSLVGQQPNSHIDDGKSSDLHLALWVGYSLKREHDCKTYKQNLGQIYNTPKNFH